MLKRNVLLLCMALLTACGFKLRGTYEIPAWFNHVALINQGTHRELALLLKDQLQSYHITIVPEAAGASYILTLEQDNMREQIKSVSASTAPRQYELIYTVNYSLVKAKSHAIIPQGGVTVTRQLTVNNDRILGSNSEEAMIYSEMRHDAALQIINQINRKLD